jgi:hypothetical protein
MPTTSLTMPCSCWRDQRENLIQFKYNPLIIFHAHHFPDNALLLLLGPGREELDRRIAHDPIKGTHILQIKNN